MTALWPMAILAVALMLDSPLRAALSAAPDVAPRTVGYPATSLTTLPGALLGQAIARTKNSGAVLAGRGSVRSGFRRGFRRQRRTIFYEEPASAGGLDTLISDVDTLGVGKKIPLDAQPAPGWQGFDFPDGASEEAESTTEVQQKQ